MPSQGDRHDTMIFDNCRLSALLRCPRDPGSNLGGPPDWAMHPHHRLPYGCHTKSMRNVSQADQAFHPLPLQWVAVEVTQTSLEGGCRLARPDGLQ